MPHFPSLREQFKTFADISATQSALINELSALQAKTSLTSGEITRYNAIIEALSSTIVSANDINNIILSILNIEEFLENQPLYYRGGYSSSRTYEKNDLVHYEGSVYVCLVNCTNVLPTNTSYWTLFVRRGTAANLAAKRYTYTLKSTASSVSINSTLAYKHGYDCLLLFMNGLLLQEDSDYSINSTGTTVTKKSGSWIGASDYDIIFDFVVIQNEYSAEAAIAPLT